MGIFDSLFGSDDPGVEQVSTLSPIQQKYLKKYFKNPIEKNATYGAGNDYIQRLLSGDPELMQQFTQPYMDQFNEEIVPGIAQRFAGMGTGAGAGSSSGLNNSLAQAGKGLQTNLAQLRGNMQLQALPQALAYAQQPYSNQLAGLGLRTTENINRPGNEGMFGGLLNAGLQGAATAFGGPLGGALYSGASSLFNKGSSGVGGLNNFQNSIQSAAY